MIVDAPAPVKKRANAMMREAAEATFRLPFFCECDDPGCLQAIWLSPAEYDARTNGSRAPLLSEDPGRPLARAG